MTEKSGKRAIVIGASIGGLLAARSLADHFETVTMLERDIFPLPGENRKGVPQGKHTHVLLARGYEIMKNYLPGLSAELNSLQAVSIPDVSANVRWFSNGAYHQPGTSGISGLGVSRPTLEAAIRKDVLQLPNVRAIPGCDVTGLLTSDNNARVTGVRLKKRQNGGEEQTMSADLVVDAGGRGSRTPAWLEALGYQRAQEAEVKVNLGYTSRYYRRPKDALSGINGIVLMAQPPNKRLGVLMDQDRSRWVVTLGGYLGDHAPTDPEEFTEFARSLPTPDIYNLISRAEPLGDPVAYKFSANLRRFYEKLNHFPAGYLVIGDAICSFNPTYAQGMTVAALEAGALGEWLTESGERSPRSYFKKIAQIVEAPWQITVGNDLRFPAVRGRRTPPIRFLNWYFEKLHHAAHIDSQVSVAFLKVINMVAPPPSVFHPLIASKVVFGNLWPAYRRTSQGGARYEPLKDLHTTTG